MSRNWFLDKISPQKLHTIFFIELSNYNVTWLMCITCQLFIYLLFWGGGWGVGGWNYCLMLIKEVNFKSILEEVTVKLCCRTPRGFKCFDSVCHHICGTNHACKHNKFLCVNSCKERHKYLQYVTSIYALLYVIQFFFIRNYCNSNFKLQTTIQTLCMFISCQDLLT